MKETDDEWEKRVSRLGTIAFVRESRKRTKRIVREAEEERTKYDWLFDENAKIPDVEPLKTHESQIPTKKERLSFDDVKFEFEALSFLIVHQGLLILVPILTLLIIFGAFWLFTGL